MDENYINMDSVRSSTHGSVDMIGVFQDDFGHVGGMESPGAVYNDQQCLTRGEAINQKPLPSMFIDQHQWDPYQNYVGQLWPQQDSRVALMSSSTIGVNQQHQPQQQNDSCGYTGPSYTQLDSCHITSGSNSSSVSSLSPIQSPTSPFSSITSPTSVASIDGSSIGPTTENVLPESISILGSCMSQKYKSSTGLKTSTNTHTRKAPSKDKLRSVTKTTGIDKKEQNAINARKNREKKKQEIEEMKNKIDEVTAIRDSLKKECEDLSVKENHIRAHLQEVAKRMGVKMMIVPQQMCPSDPQSYPTGQIPQVSINKPIGNTINPHNSHLFNKPVNFGEGVTRCTGIHQQ